MSFSKLFDKLEISLYDIMGYLFPGFILLLALSLVIFILGNYGLFPKNNIQTVLAYGIGLLKGPGSVWIFVLSYLLGHMTQAIANVLVEPFGRFIKFRSHVDIKALKEKAQKKASEVIGVEEKDIKDQALLDICSYALERANVKDKREIFVARRGFYKGLCVSFLLLSLAFLWALFSLPYWNISLKDFTGNEILGSPLLFNLRLLELLLMILSVMGSILSYIRYLRFKDYHSREVIIGYLIL